MRSVDAAFLAVNKAGLARENPLLDVKAGAGLAFVKALAELEKAI